VLFPEAGAAASQLIVDYRAHLSPSTRSA